MPLLSTHVDTLCTLNARVEAPQNGCNTYRYGIGFAYLEEGQNICVLGHAQGSLCAGEGIRREDVPLLCFLEGPDRPSSKDQRGCDVDDFEQDVDVI